MYEHTFSLCLFIKMSLRTALINGKNKNYDKDVSKILEALAGANWGIITGFIPAPGTIGAGNAFVPVTRAGEIFLVYVEDLASNTVDTTGTKKIWLEVKQANINDGSINAVNGLGIAQFNSGTNWPATPHAKIASVTSGTVTDAREFIGVLSTRISLASKMLSEIGDVSDATANENDYLKRVGWQWVPTQLSQSDLPTVSVVNEKRFYAGENLASKDAVFLETQYSPDFTNPVSDAGGSLFYSNYGRSSTSVVRVLANKTIRLSWFTIDSSGTWPTVWQVTDDSNNVLASGSITSYSIWVEGLWLIFQKNTYFKIVYHNNGSNYWTNERNTATGTNVNIVSATGGYWAWGAISQIDTKSEYVYWDDIGATSAHTRQSFPFFSSGVSSNSLDVYLSKIGSPSTSCILEVQSDNAGLPSGTVLCNVTVAPWTITADGKYTVTLSANINQPIGTRLHLVAKQTSDTVNGSNYYRIGCLAGKHTTTRNRNFWNGSAWVDDTSGVFPLAYSTAMLYTVLSKCDADYWYKSQKYGLALQAYTVWQLAECHRDGLVTGLSLGGAGTVYISNTPWLYSLTKGTSGIMVWYSQDGTSMRIYANDVEEKIWLVWCTQSDIVQHIMPYERTVNGGYAMAKQFIPKYTGTVKINFQWYYSDGNSNYLSAEFRTTVGWVQTGYTATGTRNTYVALSMNCYVVAGMPVNIEIKGNGSSAGAKIKDVQICYNVTSLNTYAVLQD